MWSAPELSEEGALYKSELLLLLLITILSLFHYSRHNVVLADFETIKECFVTRGIEFGGRQDVHGPMSMLFKYFSPIYPIVGKDYQLSL